MPVKANDAFLFFNFREDRMRELVAALCLENFDGFERSAPLPKYALGFTEYDASFGLPYLFAPLDISNHLGQVISDQGLLQLRTAETEKYPHVTYFMNGKIENPYPGEDRELLPSPRDVPTYDLKPEMSAYQVRDKVLESIQAHKHDLIVVNFANCDMVGHTGVLEAGIKAAGVVDECLGEILTALEKQSGRALIIADHGNAEQMRNPDGSPHTAHTTFPVPIVLLGVPEATTLRDGGALCDVAPTILKMMGLEKPGEMTGESLY
jgi:2,3-bisphosphoglycerate-independent phosphoglycerate mutase